MCGIVGIHSKKPIEERGVLEAMRDSMSHRGPDDAGAWWSSDGCLGLAHRRLSVIDLSLSGHQPMGSPGEECVVVFNGEIYNFRELRKDLIEKGRTFRSTSDTEVLLQAYEEWGEGCLSRLTGAFAFAIYDGRKGELFLARDRAGEKPLFYTRTGDHFAFASELKALMAWQELPRTLDLDALDYYLAYGYVSGSRAILKNVNKLKPGHGLRYKLGEMKAETWCYWELPEPQPRSIGSVEESLSELERLFAESVQSQMTADVPVGVLLSGGLDSSLVTAFAAKVSDKPVRTFTVTFPGHGSFDEGPYAKLVADHFGTRHTELVAEPASVSLLPRLARQYDEPLADHSILPTSILSDLVKKSVTVALGGDGGDELFGGYPHYCLLQRIEHLRGRVPGSLRRAGSFVASHILPVGTRGRNHLIGFGGRPEFSISAINIFFDTTSRRKLLEPLYRFGYGPSHSPESEKAASVKKGLSAFDNAARIDFFTTLSDGYLVKSDRASMLYSLELRAPFLDRKLVEFAFASVPAHLKATMTERKVLLRRLGAKVLPPELDLGRKQGFTLPLGAWFKGDWGTYTSEVLSQASPDIFEQKAIARLLSGQHRGFANTERLFALTMFELWRREYRVSL